MKSIILLLLFLNCLMFAQVINDSEYFLLLHDNTEIGFVFNPYLVSQDFNSKESLNINNVMIMQQGNGNECFIHQDGINNNTSLIQEGNKNYYEGTSEGISINLQSEQLGDDNSLIQFIRSNNLEYFIQQRGSENQILQIEGGVNTLPCKIYQNGFDLRLIIINGK